MYLPLQVRKDQDAGVYACIARNTFGEVTSRNATLDVASKFPFLSFLVTTAGFTLSDCFHELLLRDVIKILLGVQGHRKLWAYALICFPGDMCLHYVGMSKFNCWIFCEKSCWLCVVVKLWWDAETFVVFAGIAWADDRWYTLPIPCSFYYCLLMAHLWGLK